MSNQKNMVIGIDARMMGPHCGGLGRYVEQLLNHLQNIEDDHEYVVFLRKDNWENFVPKNNKFRKVLADVPWYGWQEQTAFLKILKNEKLDLMHFPHWNVPLLYDRPFVVTIHDLLLLHYPTREASMLGPVSYWFKQQAFRRVLSHAIRKAQHIFTPSDFTRQDIHNTFGIRKSKMTVTYEAPIVSESQIDPEKITKVKKKYGIKKPYALYVGVAYPHKYLHGLMKAWQKMEEKYEFDANMVLVGKENYFYKKLKATIYLNEQTENAIFTGFVPDEELHALYAGASVYIFPSLYEGFGLPPLEAMSHGVPVVSSNRTCLPEILGSAALYIDPESSEFFADAIYKAFTDENIRFDLRQAAKEELKKFSWGKMVRQTHATYLKVLGI